MGDLFTSIKELFSGRKTHIIVLLTIIATTFNHVIEQGGDVTDISMWIDNAKLALVSTFKMMFDRNTA